MVLARYLLGAQNLDSRLNLPIHLADARTTYIDMRVANPVVFRTRTHREQVWEGRSHCSLGAAQ